eukprot:scaffold126_cov315-Pavlova_lutheri.AAC.15
MDSLYSRLNKYSVATPATAANPAATAAQHMAPKDLLFGEGAHAISVVCDAHQTEQELGHFRGEHHLTCVVRIHVSIFRLDFGCVYEGRQ